MNEELMTVKEHEIAIAHLEEQLNKLQDKIDALTESNEDLQRDIYEANEYANSLEEQIEKGKDEDQ